MFERWRAPNRWRSVLVSSATTRALVPAGLLIAAIAFLDQRTSPSVGLLYLFPIILVGTVLPRWGVVVTALLCTWLTVLFNHFAVAPAAAWGQDTLVLAAMAGTGLVAYELTRSRRREIEHRRAVEREAAARREAEEQLAFVINTSPVAILTMTAEGDVLSANLAAHRVFGIADGQLPGRNIADYVPALARVPGGAGGGHAFQTEMQCRGERQNGTVFPANVFFSTYNTGQGARLAAMVVDTSAELVEREESNLEQLMSGSRVLVSAVTHEVRNLCGAVAVVHENLARSGKVQGDQDFEALGTLVDALTRIATAQLKRTSRQSRAGSVDLREVLDDIRLVLDPYCEDAGIEVSWHYDVPDQLLQVRVDRHHLLQALLNLVKNSQRALQGSEVKRIAFSATAAREVVSLRVSDSGPGPAAIGRLFQPFQHGAASTGLGLYLSRALLRSFRGDLRYDPNPGCSFVIDLPLAALREQTEGHSGIYDTHSVAAR